MHTIKTSLMCSVPRSFHAKQATVVSPRRNSLYRLQILAVVRPVFSFNEVWQESAREFNSLPRMTTGEKLSSAAVVWQQPLCRKNFLGDANSESPNTNLQHTI